MRNMRCWFLTLVILCFSHAVPGAKDYFLVWNPKLEMQVGAENLFNAYRIFGRFEDSLTEKISFQENTLIKRIIGIAGRIGKTAALDLPVAGWLTLIQHEYFGHGSRFREFQVKKVEYNLGSPWNLSGWARGSGYFGWNEWLSIDAGGMESNQVFTHEVIKKVFTQKDIHYYELLPILFTKLDTSNYILSTWDPDSHLEEFSQQYREGHDVANYLVYFTFSRSRYSLKKNYDKLVNGAIWNAVDPILFLAYYYSYLRYIWSGKKVFRVPMLRLGNIEFLPSTRFNLTPMGYERYLDIWLRKKPTLWNFYIREGDGLYEGDDSYGLGVEINNIVMSRKIKMNCSFDYWHQQDVRKEDWWLLSRWESEPPPPLEGININISLVSSINKFFALKGVAGYKNDGYLMGREFEGGVYGLVGVGLSF